MASAFEKRQFSQDWGNARGADFKSYPSKEMYRDALDFSHNFLKMLLYIFLQAPPAFRDTFSSDDLLLILQFCFKLLES